MIRVQIRLVNPIGSPAPALRLSFLSKPNTRRPFGGTIFDPTGAAVFGTKVNLQNLGTGATRTYITGADGLYVFFAMPAGDYELTAEPCISRRNANESKS